MAQQKPYTSDESTATIGKNVVFSTAPKIIGIQQDNFYKILDHDKSAVQLRLMPYTDKGGGTRVVFNLTWPQYAALSHAIKQALIFDIGRWDLAEKWDGAGHTELCRVFGSPVKPAEMMTKFQGRFADANAATGFCPARILQLRRDTRRADGSVAKYPWYIKIQNGYARKISVASGGSYMERKSFIESAAAQMNISDGEMYEHAFWNEELMNMTVQTMGPYIMDLHRKFIESKNSWKETHYQQQN